MGLRVAATAPAAAGVRVLGGSAARVTPRPRVAPRGSRRLSVRMSVATTETTTSATAAVGAVSLLSLPSIFLVAVFLLLLLGRRSS
jgi:glucose-1-phosphate adenylyltransferase